MHRLSTTVRAVLVAALSLSVIEAAFADGDKAEEARYQAQRKARAEAAQREAAESKARSAKAEADVQRRLLGKPAEGKTDAEVKVLWDKRNADAKAQQAAMQAAMPGMMSKAQAAQQKANDPKTRADADAGARMMGAKSMQDLMNMSDEDLKKLQAEMEKKHGKS